MKQSLTEESHYSRYYNSFDKKLSVRVVMISLGSLKSKYIIRHSFTNSLENASQQSLGYTAVSFYARHTL